MNTSEEGVLVDIFLCGSDARGTIRALGKFAHIDKTTVDTYMKIFSKTQTSICPCKM